MAREKADCRGCFFMAICPVFTKANEFMDSPEWGHAIDRDDDTTLDDIAIRKRHYETYEMMLELLAGRCCYYQKGKR